MSMRSPAFHSRVMETACGDFIETALPSCCCTLAVTPFTYTLKFLPAQHGRRTFTVNVGSVPTASTFTHAVSPYGKAVSWRSLTPRAFQSSVAGAKSCTVTARSSGAWVKTICPYLPGASNPVPVQHHMESNSSE